MIPLLIAVLLPLLQAKSDECIHKLAKSSCTNEILAWYDKLEKDKDEDSYVNTFCNGLDKRSLDW